MFLTIWFGGIFKTVISSLTKTEGVRYETMLEDIAIQSVPLTKNIVICVFEAFSGNYTYRCVNVTMYSPRLVFNWEHPYLFIRLLTSTYI